LVHPTRLTTLIQMIVITSKGHNYIVNIQCLLIIQHEEAPLLILDLSKIWVIMLYMRATHYIFLTLVSDG